MPSHEPGGPAAGQRSISDGWLLARATIASAGLALLAWTSSAASVSLSAPTTAGRPPLRAQSDQIAAGRQTFDQICYKCHGDQGEGDIGPAIAGPNSDLVTYRNARRLFDYVRDAMPDDDPGSLSEQQYYDVVAFLMDWNNLNPGGVPVNGGTVEDITFSR